MSRRAVVCEQPIMDLIAKSVGMSVVPGAGTEVQVEVEGPKKVPDSFKEIRARARALASAGVLPTTKDSVENLTMGEIKRFTRVRGSPSRIGTGRFTEKLTYRVIVSRD